MEVPELLSPAGGPEALRAAVANGADAVYLGGTRFNARLQAANFGLEEMGEAVEYAHHRGVKIYVTVNTLLLPQELLPAADYLYHLREIGVDAVLVQDLGLLAVLRQLLADLPVHASTQMTVHNLAGVRWLAEQGVSRVVLAREVSLADIEVIHQAVPQVEVEIFAHGALCFAYSGQCLFSSMVGGRSGNRGLCAQPCRLGYALVEGEGSREVASGHLLSTQDLCLLEYLPQVAAAGVAALKIEGRMKRPEYVAVVTRIYREALDRLQEDPDNYLVTEEERQTLAQIFNRGFTTGYLRGNPGGDLIGYQRPNNRGVYLGRVVGVDASRHLAQVDVEKAPLAVGDGVAFWVKQGLAGSRVDFLELQGQRVDRVEPPARVQMSTPPGVRSGDRVFKTADQELLAEARRSYTSVAAGQRVALQVTLEGGPGRVLRLWGRDALGRQAQVQGHIPGEVAEKRPLTTAVAAAQLGRLGGTPYYLAGVRVRLDGPVIYPLRELNALRRDLVEALLQQNGRRPVLPRQEWEARRAVLAGYQPASWPASYTGPRQGNRQIPRLAVTVSHPAAARAALAAGADRIYLAAERFRSLGRFSFQDLEEACQVARKEGREVVYALPRLWLTGQEEAVRRLLEKAALLSVSGLLIANPGGLVLAREAGLPLPLYGDYPLNVTNARAVNFLREQGLQGVTFSPELNFRQLADLAAFSDLPWEVVVHGRLPLMISEHCVPGAIASGRRGLQRCSRPCHRQVFALRDRRGFIFPLETDQYCRMYLFNAHELCLVDDLPRLAALGVDAVRIEARRAEPAYVARVTSIYREVLDELASGRPGREDWIAWRQHLAAISPGGLTKGHYYRGVD